MDPSGKRVLVVGMAASGIASARFLAARGARVVLSEMRPAADLRPEIAQLLDTGIAIETGGHRERSFLDADLIVVSPGVPADLPLLRRARAEKIPVWGEIELASRFLQGPIVAITGANGKTTTTSLTASLIAALGRTVQVGGNIGTPLISLVDTSTPSTVNVVEVSSFQLETIEIFHPHIAAVLNLSPDHLDRHGSMEAYAAAKQRIFLNQTPADFAILNPGDTWCRTFSASIASQPVWFAPFALAAPTPNQPAAQTGANVRDGEVVWTRQQGPNARHTPILPVAEIPLRGAHNLENVLAAVSIACLLAEEADAASDPTRAAAAAAPALRRAVRTFKAVEHRLEFVSTVQGVAYYNDSKATNVDATMKALEAFPSGIWLILGGKDKGSDYTTLLPLLRQRAHAALLIGAATEKIAGQLAASGFPLIRCGTLDQAVQAARERATAGDTVLLAPACASFDQFQNYGHRGDVFKRLVRDMMPTPIAGPDHAQAPRL